MATAVPRSLRSEKPFAFRGTEPRLTRDRVVVAVEDADHAQRERVVQRSGESHAQTVA